MNQPCLVIMAAGMGSRFGGPKQTTPVDEYGHFLLHYSLFDAYRAGFRKVVFVVKEDTAEEFRESVGPAVAAAFDVRYAYQKLDTLPAGYAVPAGRTKPWGTAHAVLCAAPEIDGPFAVINSDDYYGIEAYRLLYDFLAVPRPERSYAMVGFRLRNTVTANGSVSRGVCTERNGMLESITERTHIEQRGADAAYTEDGEHFIDLPGDTTVSMNFWGFSPLYLRELARRFPAFLDESLPRNPLKCEYFVPSIVDAQLRAGTADVTMLHTNDAWHGVTYHDDLPDVVAALRALRDCGQVPGQHLVSAAQREPLRRVLADTPAGDFPAGAFLWYTVFILAFSRGAYEATGFGHSGARGRREDDTVRGAALPHGRDPRPRARGPQKRAPGHARARACARHHDLFAAGAPAAGRHGGHAARHAGPRGLFRRDGAHAAGARLCRARHQRHGRRAGAHGNALAAAAALPRAGVCVRDEDGPAGRGPRGAHGRPARAPERRVCGLHRPRPGADRPVRRGGARAVS